MGLTNEIIAEFVKVTNENTAKQSTESTVYATTVEYEGRVYVRIDGSDLLTPVSKTVDVKPDERVTVMIKDHTATITGNLSSPAARTDDLKETASKINEFEIVMAYKVTTDDLEAVNASIEQLKATTARIEDATIVNAQIESLEALFATLDHVSAKDMEVITATIESIEAEFAKITDISAEDLEAVNAEITNLKGYTAEFTYVSAEVLDAVQASIKTLEVEKLSAEQADIKYANIDFSNINRAAVEQFFATSGIIKDFTFEEGTVTGELVGVTIKGDLIEGGTVVADKLVIKGEDGLYYKLNSGIDGVTQEQLSTEEYQSALHGSIIIANSITADKIRVSDLVAFGATIGGFHIEASSEDKPGAIYSGVKESVHNPTTGSYSDTEGQVAFGDNNNFIKFYKTDNGVYKLDISASSILLNNGSNDLADLLNAIYLDLNEGSMTFGLGENSMSLRLEHDEISFRKGNEVFGRWDGVDFHTGNIIVSVNERAQFGNFAFLPRSDDSLMFVKINNSTAQNAVGNAIIGTATVG